MKTWQTETMFVGAVLAVVCVASGGGWLEAVGALAVLLSFGHAQVADRLAEAEHKRSMLLSDGIARRSVRCHRWATRYLVGKETLWLVYFVAHRSWSALAGVGLFLAYPLWRRWWRKRNPL